MNYPKVELHCHLDGAIPYRLFVKYCREAGFVPEGVSDEEWIAQNVMNESMSLSEGLEKFVLLTAILQTGDHLTEVTETLLDDMYNAGTRLAELRFAPQSHTQGELGMEEAVQAVLEGRRKALEKHPDMVVGILLCMMNYGQSWGNEINNRATIQLADKYRDQGVRLLHAGLPGVNGVDAICLNLGEFLLRHVALYHIGYGRANDRILVLIQKLYALYCGIRPLIKLTGKKFHGKYSCVSRNLNRLKIQIIYGWLGKDRLACLLKYLVGNVLHVIADKFPHCLCVNAEIVF